MAGVETNYAFRISITGEGGKSPLGYIRFGDKGPKGIMDSNKDGYYGIDEFTPGKLRIVRYTWHKYHDGRVKGTGDRNHRVLAFGRDNDIELLRKYAGEYDCFEESTTSGGTTRIFTVDISNKANFSTMYARKSGQTADIEEAPKTPVFKDKPYDPTHLSKIAALSNEDAAKLSKEIIMGSNKVNNDPLATIDNIMGEQLKELETKIKKLQAELEPLLEARLRLTRARECLKYNCEMQKGE